MRRLAGLALCAILLLTGCRSQQAAEPVSHDFSCTVQAVYRELAVEGTLTRTSAGTLTLVFSEPPTLDGLTARWDGETVTLSMYGMSFSVDPAAVPESALGEELLAAFDSALRGEGEQRIENGKRIVSGNGANGAYTLVFDAASGVPLSLSVPSLPLTATFLNVTQ